MTGLQLTLLICRTCPRYDPHSSGEFGRRLNDAIADSEISGSGSAGPGATVGVRNVACLGGCPRNGVVALDGPGKTRVRFTGLAVHDAQAILRAAESHDTSATGDPAEWHVPAELIDRISSITAKRIPHAR